MKEIITPLKIDSIKDFSINEPGFYEQMDKTSFGNSILEDGAAKYFMPATFRLFSQYEAGQLIRFWIVLNWIKMWHTTKYPIKGILDLGCSYSKLYQMWYNNANFMNWPSISYWGEDANKNTLLSGRNEILKRHKKSDEVVHVLGDISTQTQFPIEFDVIVSMGTIEHIPMDKVNNLLWNIYNNLSSKGFAVLSGQNQNAGNNANHFHDYSLEEIKEIVMKFGFTIIKKVFLQGDKNIRNTMHGHLKPIRNKLIEYLPSSIVNNLISMLLDSEKESKQWMVQFIKTRKILLRGKHGK